MQPSEVPVALPFGGDFQKSLLRLIVEDDQFAHRVLPHLQPTFFENEVLAWCCGAVQRYREQYGGTPTIRTLREECNRVDARMRPVYVAVLEQIATASLREEQWLRDKVLDFVKRNIFVRSFHETRSLYNGGKVEEAYDTMMERMEQITRATWEPIDGEWIGDDFASRHSRRIQTTSGSDAISTGFPTWLDPILRGGLKKGEMGMWIAYAKGGKSTMLVNHGVAAMKISGKRVLHFVLEGMRSQVLDRYDAALMDELYANVKYGNIDGDKYAKAWTNYQWLKGLGYVRGFTDRWDYSIVDVNEEMRRLKRSYNWEPDLIIIDYGDLLSGREKTYDSERMKQMASYRDMKSLANRGYAIWTATQAQRPKEGAEDTVGWIHARQVADSYDKPRIVDFCGSINATTLEKEGCKIGGVVYPPCVRLLAEMYRDNAAGQTTIVRADWARMQLREEPGLKSPETVPDAKETAAQIPLQTKQRVAAMAGR